MRPATAPEQSALPKSAIRYPMLDGARGIFLIAMLISHANMAMDVMATKLDVSIFGWVESTQGFVFISGLVTALVYGRALDRKGLGECARRIFLRVRTIYLYHAALVLVMLVAAFWLADWPGADVLRHFRSEPFWFTLSSLTLTSAAIHMGILPLYIYLMAFLPFVLFAVSRGHWPAVLLGSLLLWLLAQSHIPDLWLASAQGLVDRTGVTMPIGIYFSIIGWQLLFYGAAIIGYYMSRGELSASFMRTPAYRSLVFVALAGMAAFFITKRMVYGHFMPTEWTTWLLNWHDRSTFTLMSLVNTICYLIVFPWMVLVGFQERSVLLRWPSQALQWLVTRKPLVFLGNHSLAVFSFHILLVLLLELAVGDRAVGEWQGALIVLGGILLLFIPARLDAIHKERKKARTLAAAQG